MSNRRGSRIMKRNLQSTSARKKKKFISTRVDHASGIVRGKVSKAAIGNEYRTEPPKVRRERKRSMALLPGLLPTTASPTSEAAEPCGWEKGSP